MSVTLCVLYLFLCICLGEHSHPAASGRSFSGCSSFPVFRQCPAAGFMVNHIQYITYTLHYTHTGLVHLILLWFSAQWLQQEKKKKIYKGFPNANGFISVKHINTVCSSGSFRLSALTHFIQLWLCWSKNQTQDKHFIVTVTYIFIQMYLSRLTRLTLFFV